MRQKNASCAEYFQENVGKLDLNRELKQQVVSDLIGFRIMLHTF